MAGPWTHRSVQGAGGVFSRMAAEFPSDSGNICPSLSGIYGRAGKLAVGGAFAGGGVPSVDGTGDGRDLEMPDGRAFGNSHLFRDDLRETGEYHNENFVRNN